jgi:hypothetical protein
VKQARAQRTTAGSIGLLLIITALACTRTTTIPSDTPVTPKATPADAWTALLQEKPYPYAAPLPAAQATVVDGTYTKVDPRPGDRAGCRRCPPYPPEGGLWKLRLAEGTFWVLHKKTAWHTQGSFTISKDQIEFFNDPHCHQELGRYRWKLAAGQLILEVIHDECGFGLRAAGLTAQPWLSCQPPSTEAAISDHWQKPPGCD